MIPGARGPGGPAGGPGRRRRRTTALPRSPGPSSAMRGDVDGNFWVKRWWVYGNLEGGRTPWGLTMSAWGENHEIAG
eukprot:765335-Hanusia_phi.AAC.8